MWISHLPESWVKCLTPDLWDIANQIGRHSSSPELLHDIYGSAHWRMAYRDHQHIARAYRRLWRQIRHNSADQTQACSQVTQKINPTEETLHHSHRFFHGCHSNTDLIEGYARPHRWGHGSGGCWSPEVQDLSEELKASFRTPGEELNSATYRFLTQFVYVWPTRWS